MLRSTFLPAAALRSVLAQPGFLHQNKPHSPQIHDATRTLNRAFGLD
ncbi:hypothetical protein PDIG_64930 [Penicillium digitatum PHI26]|uniref:Uncharacterized protein n=2 Tax=Penicillium digitatum TaxID=36651 RepID=K9FHB9_PEND2|nr:hypothetical protein PDIP_74260 [Penicillium digitatum Pd1]EKV07335.1 hypothetical protein PDIP_74260 [Penicillium digitatum Pd1]EKV08629.1 hypothetical protein PDIG_64930 [Penicillium digitatum PHI26]